MEIQLRQMYKENVAGAKKDPREDNSNKTVLELELNKRDARILELSTQLAMERSGAKQQLAPNSSAVVVSASSAPPPQFSSSSSPLDSVSSSQRDDEKAKHMKADLHARYEKEFQAYRQHNEQLRLQYSNARKHWEHTKKVLQTELKEYNGQWQHRWSQLEQEKSNIEQRYNTEVENNRKLAEKLKAATNEHQLCQQQLREIQEKEGNLLLKLQYTEQEIENSKATVSEYELAHSNLSKSVHEKQKECLQKDELLQQQERSQQQSKTVMEIEISQWKHNCSLLQVDHNKISEELKKQKLALREQEIKYVGLEELLTKKASQYKHELNRARQKTQLSERNCRELVEQLKIMEKELEKCVDAGLKSKTEIAACKHAHTEAEQRVNECLEKITDLETHYRVATERVGELERVSERTVESNKKLKQELLVAKNQRSTLQAKFIHSRDVLLRKLRALQYEQNNMKAEMTVSMTKTSADIVNATKQVMFSLTLLFIFLSLILLFLFICGFSL